MEIVDNAKLLIGIAFALAGVTMLVLARGSRGFTQRKQAGALFLVAAAVFVGVGLGWIDL